MWNYKKTLDKKQLGIYNKKTMGGLYSHQNVIKRRYVPHLNTRRTSFTTEDFSAVGGRILKSIYIAGNKILRFLAASGSVILRLLIAAGKQAFMLLSFAAVNIFKLLSPAAVKVFRLVSAVAVRFSILFLALTMRIITAVKNLLSSLFI